MKDIDITLQFAQLKENDYKTTLAVTSLIELLIQKGIINKKELAQKANHLDNIITHSTQKTGSSI